MLIRYFIAIVAGLGFFLSHAIAQSYPTRPVRLLVGFPPGGSADILARVFATELEKPLGQPMVVENRPGADGLLAAGLLAKATPDGYTLGVVVPGNVTNLLLYKGKDVPYDVAKDFAPIAPMATTPLVLVVTPSLPVNSVKDLVALAKAKSGALNYGSAGHGSSHQFFTELMNNKTGIKITHVPYQGGGPAIRATMAGEVAMTWVSVASGSAQIQAGTLKPLATSLKTRLPSMPNVPTMIESGIAGYAADVWLGIQAPAGTPRPVIARINAEMNGISKSPSMLDRFSKMGMIPMYQTPEEFTATIADEAAKWSGLLKDGEFK